MNKTLRDRPLTKGKPKKKMVDVALGLVSLIRCFRLGDYKIKRQPLFFISLKQATACVKPTGAA
jgi:hypothetical protein